MRDIEGVTNRQLLLGSGLGNDAIDAMLIDLLMPHPRNPARPRWSRTRTSTRFEHCEPTRVGFVPVVSDAWAATDAAKTHSRRDLAALVTKGIGANWLTIKAIEQVIELRGVFPGVGNITRLLEELKVDHPYSGTERRLTKRCRDAGLSLTLNQEIR